MSTQKKTNQKAKGQGAAYKLFGHDARRKGEDIHRINARKLLGPFCSPTLEGAAADQLSEEFADQEITEIARVYNNHRLAAAAAPRLNAPRRSLAVIAEKADELGELLSSMGEVERCLFEMGGLVNEIPKRFYSRARGDWLPRSSVMPKPDSESKWLDQLRGLSKLARILLKIHMLQFGPDVGGRTNVHTAMFNSPEYRLILQGWELFERFKPGQANTSETGLLHIFLQQIYEYATGEGANEPGAPALLPKIKQMIGPLREVERCKREVQAAEVARADFERSLRAGDRSLEKIEGIVGELKKSNEQLGKILPGAIEALKTATTRRRIRS